LSGDAKVMTKRVHYEGPGKKPDEKLEFDKVSDTSASGRKR
jgi:hypothetical protein